MEKRSTPSFPVGLGGKKPEQPSDKTITFLLNFARLYVPVVSSNPKNAVVLN